MSMSSSDNPYSRLNYRRLIAWPTRIERESPFLMEEIDRAPARSVVDLGCGTGEHARHLAAEGCKVLGVDRSEAQIASAREYENEFAPRGPHFECGEIEDLPELTRQQFGAAICLGNVLPHLDDAPLGRALEAVAARLLEGGRLVLQVVNYEKVLGSGERHLPLNVREAPEDGAEIVFLRLMKPEGDHHVRFFPTTLVLRPGADPPLEIESSKEVLLRAWRRPELEELLERSGFSVEGVYGAMDRSVFEAERSSDLIITAARRGSRTV